MSVYRLLFFLSYNPPGKPFSGSAFVMGLRFDLKFSCIIGLGILCLCAFPILNPFKHYKANKFWNIILPLLMVVLLIFLGTDFYHYAYLQQRLNASVLNYLQDAGISMGMVWQTYPVIKVILAMVLIILIAGLIFKLLLQKYQTQYCTDKRKGILKYLVFVILLSAGIFGKFNQYPLRWSDAFTLSDDFKANLALNPMQSFFSTLKFKDSKIDIEKVRAVYPLMAAHLGVTQPDNNNLSFERKVIASDSVRATPNIVLVICESFSAYKSNMFGNPLNTTPFFNDLCSKGVLFDRCFTPSYGTARGVWATLTGMPDVESPKTASRNPSAVDQHILINDLAEYEKFYFLGGDPTWANIQGLLSNNIKGLQIYQQDNFKAPKIDVWGISDKNLFLEANQKLKEQTKPFFAIIQTADNHRPYTIPEEDASELKHISFPNDSLFKYGFENDKELRAFRYTDYCFQKFMEAAQKENYFKNTLFVFIGDHGIRGNASQFPKVWNEQGLTAEHVPLLFYYPDRLKPQRLSDICSQIDVLPSIASFTCSNYSNTTLGRNLFDRTNKKNNIAFIYDEGLRTIGILNDEYYYLRHLKSVKEDFLSMVNNESVPKNKITDSIKNNLKALTDAYYTTSKYLLLNNKKRN